MDPLPFEGSDGVCCVAVFQKHCPGPWLNQQWCSTERLHMLQDGKRPEDVCCTYTFISEASKANEGSILAALTAATAERKVCPGTLVPFSLAHW
jgi:hypothetical protein